jgi:hypothetical protein
MGSESEEEGGRGYPTLNACAMHKPSMSRILLSRLNTKLRVRLTRAPKFQGGIPPPSLLLALRSHPRLILGLCIAQAMLKGSSTGRKVAWRYEMTSRYTCKEITRYNIASTLQTTVWPVVTPVWRPPFLVTKGTAMNIRSDSNHEGLLAFDGGEVG